MTAAVLLVSHGTVEDLDDLGAFVTNVRRGHAPPPELVHELRLRYEAVGGSPLNAINAAISRKLAAKLGVATTFANRLWKPYTRDVVSALAREGVTRIALVPLAQHSAAVYAADATPATEAAGITLRAAPNWGQHPELCEAFASRIALAVRGVDGPEKTTVVLTAHSLPQSVVDAGDPYEREVRAAADTIAMAVKRRLDGSPHFLVAFQSQGFASRGPGGRPIPWLGPDLGGALAEAEAQGSRRIVFAPAGFLADHVEILYDLDVEARAMCTERGLVYARATSLNADDDFIEVLASVARPLLECA